MCGGCARTGLSLTSRRLANRQGCGDAGGSVQVGRPVLHIAGSLSGLARELCCAWLPVWGEPSVAAAGQGIGRCGCSGPELAFAWPRAWGGRLLASSLEPEQVCYLLRCARRRQRALSRNAGRCAPVPGGGCLEELGYRWMHHGAVHGPGVRNADRSPPAPAASGIVQVSGGCGLYGFRDYYGYCRPRRVFVARPRYYGCPFRFHPTPYGCRPNY